MKCPNCIATQLVNRRREWLTVELCPDCQGIWLQRKEFERLLMDSQRAQSMVDDDWNRESGRITHGQRTYDQRDHDYDHDDEGRDTRRRYRTRDGYRRKTWFEQLRDFID